MPRNDAQLSRRNERINTMSCRFVGAILVMCILMVMYMLGSFRSSASYSEGRTYVLGGKVPPSMITQLSENSETRLARSDTVEANDSVHSEETPPTEKNKSTSAKNAVFGDFTVELKGINHTETEQTLVVPEEIRDEAQAVVENAASVDEVDVVDGNSSIFTDFVTQEYHRMHCLRDVRNKLRDALRPYVQHYPGGVALVDVTLHTNLGDNVLWRGAVSLMADFGISPRLVCSISQPSWIGKIDNIIPKCHINGIIDVVKNKGMVLLQAGGNWGDLYSFVQTARMELLTKLSPLAVKYGFKIIQLPVSIYYKSPNSGQLISDIETMSKVKPSTFVLFVRSQSSYEIATQNFKGTVVKAVPDLAFAIGPMIPKDKPVYDVLIQSRQDKEKQEEDGNIWDWVNGKFKGTNLTFHVQDWWYHPEEHPREVSKPAMTVLSEVRTFAATQVVSQGKVVVTNRLHGSIVSTLVGKHLFYVDTAEGKVGFVRSNAFSSVEACAPENLHEHKADSLESAVDAAIDLIKTGGDEFTYN